MKHADVLSMELRRLGAGIFNAASLLLATTVACFALYFITIISAPKTCDGELRTVDGRVMCDFAAF
jgi:hypothetical protein